MEDQAQKLAAANNNYRSAKREIEAMAKSNEILANINDKTNKSLGEMQRELSALKNVNLSGLDADKVKEVQQAMADLTAKIQNAKNAIKGLNTGQVFANMAESIQFVAASASAFGNTLKVLGVESDVFDRLQKSAAELIAIVQALGVVTDYLSKKKWQLIAANIKNIALLTAEKVAALATAAAHLSLSKVIGFVTAAFKTLRKALISTGIGILVVAIGLLIANFDKLLNLFKKGSSKADIAMFDNMKRGVEDLMKANDKYIESLKNKGKTEAEILNASIDLQAAAMQKARETLSFAAKTFGEKSDEYKSALEIMKKANEDYEGSANSIINYLDKIVGRVEQANARRGKSEQEYTKTLLEEDKKQALIMVEKLKKTAQFFSFFDKNKGAEILKQALEYEAAIYEDYNNRLSESSKKTTDAAQKITEDRIQNNLELNKSILKANTEYDEKNIIEKQKYEMEMFLLEQQAAIDKLDNLKKYGKITEDEYKRQYDILKNNQTKFYNDQTKALAEHSKKLHEEIKKMLQSDTENQIEETTAKYQDAIKQLQNENENLSKSAGVDLSNVSDLDSILIDPKVLEQHKENMAKIAGLQTALEKRIVEIKKQGLEEYNPQNKTHTFTLFPAAPPQS